MNKISEMKFGSTLYGTSTPESDMDFKGIYLPSAKEICLGNYKKTVNTQRSKKLGERNTKDDVDTELFSLDRYLELLCEGQTVALDMLFAPYTLYTELNPRWAWVISYIYNNRQEFLSSNVNAFIGYARQQASKYGVKGSRMDALKSVLDLLGGYFEQDKLILHNHSIGALVEASRDLVSLENTPLIEIIDIKAPNGKIEPHLHVAGRKIPFHATVKYAKQIFGKIYANYGQRATQAQLAGGKDYKALSHAVRVNSEARELLETGRITFPRPDADLLLKIKTIQMPFEQISEIIEQGLIDLLDAQSKSVLKAEPNIEFAKELVYRVHKEIVQEEN